MKNFYILAKFGNIMLTTFILVFMFNVRSFSQTRLDTVLVGFGQLNNGAIGDSEDNEPFSLTDDYGIVTDFKVEIIYDDTDFGTEILRLRTPLPYRDLIYVNSTSFTMDTLKNYWSYSWDYWQIWLYEEDDPAGGDSALVQITYQFDTVPNPVALCKDTILTIDASGNATLYPSEIDDGSEGYLTVDQTAFDCSNLGQNIVTLTATATDGSTATCEAIVEVTNILCKDTTLYLNSSGEATIESIELFAGLSYSCAPVDTMWLAQDTFTCSDVGENTVTLFTRSGTDTTMCYSTVTVLDTIPPAVACQAITVTLDGSGTASITAAEIDNGSMDLCGIDTMYLDVYDFDIADVGENTVTLTVVDNSGNSSSCTATVTVEGVLSTLSCQDITVYLRPNGQYVLNSSDLDQLANFNETLGSTDDITVTASPRSFDCVNAGRSVQVQVTARDLSGNESVCYANVTVMDTIAAEITCVESLDVYLDESGSARIFPRYLLDAGTDDECGSTSLSLDQSAFSCLDVGANIVTLTSTDPSGNESTCVTTVNIIDTVLACAPETVVDIIIESEDHTTLEAAVIAAGLVETLQGEGPFTVFAPTDAAFAVLPDGTLDALLADPSGQLTDILLYHVVAGKKMSSDLSDGQMIETVFGQNIIVTITSEGVFINGAKVTVADIEAKNGVVHVIDAVLLPKTIAEIVIESEDHTTLETAVIAADLVETLQGGGPFTLFAPTDAAFAALPQGTLDALLADPSGQLTDILLYHLVAGKEMSSDLSDGQMIETVFGQDITVTINSEGVFINEAEVVVADIKALNGVIHVIDAVLLPETKTVADIVIESEDHTILEEALVAVGLVDTLQGEGTFTVFAPTDEAFAALFEELGVASLSEIDTATLEAVLQMHVVSGEVTSSDLTEGMTTNTLLGQEIMFGLVGGATITDPNGRVSNITNADIEADNGVVHVIDTVILPDLNPTSIDYYNQMTLKIYPNPTTGLVNVDLQANGIHDVELSILDISGRQLIRKQFSAAERISFDLSQYVSGMYFVRLDIEGNQVMKKIILDR